ncbi:MAG: type II toxin-antitoxin system VapC family toxin [Candidatus Berkiellales bacterium]
MKYLLDTNICIYIIKKSPASVIKKFHSLAIGDIGISTVTLAELEYGVAKSAYKHKNQEALINFVIPLEILDFDANAASTYGKIRAELERTGKPIGSMDMMIAAHALAMNVVLVTNNEKEFVRIKGIQLENWVSSD